MIQIPPAIRLSFGLVLLTLSILILAQTLGLTPSDEKQQLQLRQNVAETLAVQVIFALQRNDPMALDALLINTVSRNIDMLSAAVLDPYNGPLSQTKEHTRHWRGVTSKKSTPTHIILPLYSDQKKLGVLKISFVKLNSSSSNFFGLSNFVILALFFSISGFIAYWVFIKRTLKHLDPSAVIPARVKNAFNILSEGVLILDQRHQIVLANSSLLDKLKLEEKQVLGRHANLLKWQLDAHVKTRDMPWEMAINTGITQRNIKISLKKRGHIEHGDAGSWAFQVNAVPIQDDGGHRQGTIVSFDDISELEATNKQLEVMMQKMESVQLALKKKNQELGYLASRDPLTDCFNRRALFEFLDNKFETAMHAKAQFTCIMADIDHFKNVNDTYGHSVGDEVIKVVARSIQESLREGDIIARYGGEEFCVILPRTSLDQACIVAERCRDTIAAQICQGVQVTSSFGVTSLVFGATNPQDLITQADEALYLSKENGRNCVSQWNPSLSNK